MGQLSFRWKNQWRRTRRFSSHDRLKNIHFRSLKKFWVSWKIMDSPGQKDGLGLGGAAKVERDSLRRHRAIRNGCATAGWLSRPGELKINQGGLQLTIKWKQSRRFLHRQLWGFQITRRQPCNNYFVTVFGKSSRLESPSLNWLFTILICRGVAKVFLLIS